MINEIIKMQEDNKIEEAKTLNTRAFVFAIISASCMIFLAVNFLLFMLRVVIEIYWLNIAIGIVFYGIPPISVIFGIFGCINGSVAYHRIKYRRALMSLIISVVSLIIVVVIAGYLISLFLNAIGH